ASGQERCGGTHYYEQSFCHWLHSRLCCDAANSGRRRVRGLHLVRRARKAKDEEQEVDGAGEGGDRAAEDANEGVEFDNAVGGNGGTRNGVQVFHVPNPFFLF